MPSGTETALDVGYECSSFSYCCVQLLFVRVLSFRDGKAGTSGNHAENCSGTVQCRVGNGGWVYLPFGRATMFASGEDW